MKRYYIGRRIGSGTREDPYTSELREYLYANWPNEPRMLQQVIAHTFPWVLHKYDLSDAAHADVMTLTGIFSFPEGALDRQLRDIPLARRTAIRDKLEAVGFSFGWATLDNTVRDVLEYIAHSIQLSEWADAQILAQNFDTKKTVGDIPVAARQRIAQHLNNLGIDTSGITLTTTLHDAAKMLQRRSDGSLRLFGTIKRRPWLFHDEDSE